MGNKLFPYIAFLASNLGSMMSNDAIRDALGSTAFISNHTTASSTDKLCMRMLEEFGAQINNVVSPAAVATVQNAATRYWDITLTNNITIAIRAMTYQYNKAYIMDVGQWFQGEKALMAQSGAFNAI